jgi:DNA-binding CsgD family transcriptional regulator
MRLQNVQAAVLDAVLAQRSSRFLRAQEAVGQLRDTRSASELVQRAAVEAHRIGFDRILFSRIRHGMWVPSKAYAGNDTRFAETLVEVGVAHPRRLTRALVETDMIRREAPIVVYDPQHNPRVHTEMVALAAPLRYVAAPVLAWGQPIGFLHADRQTDSPPVDESDRDVLGVFAQALGIAFERNMLSDKLRAIRHACSEYAQGVNTLADDLTFDVVEKAGITDDLVHNGPAKPVGRRPSSERRDVAEIAQTLTPRERDVLRALAEGKTNAQIATKLFVTEGTVKSHVKHVLRKLGATNRTEAVANYHRLVT